MAQTLGDYGGAESTRKAAMEWLEAHDGPLLRVSPEPPKATTDCPVCKVGGVHNP